MKLAKKLLCLALCLVTCAALVVPASAAGLDNFTQAKTYKAGQFTDVAADAWYAANVKSAFEFGLMKGNSETTFNPEGNVTIAETITVAARLYAIYQAGEENFANSSPWYQTYVDYAKENKIITSDFADYNKTATRAEYAMILKSALPEEALEAINELVDNAIPDVKTDDACGTAVYTLYRAGILTGSDEKGTFHPDSTIKRSEVAAIVSRMADKNLRKTITLKEAEAAEPADPRSKLRVELTWKDTSVKLKFHNAVEVIDEESPSGGEFFHTMQGFHVESEAGKEVFTWSDIPLHDRSGVIYYHIYIVEENFDEDISVYAAKPTVKVYRGNELLGTYTPTEKDDWGWTAFRYDVRTHTIVE